MEGKRRWGWTERILGLGHSLDYGNSVVLVEGKGEEGLRLGCAIEDHPTCISLGHKARRDEIQNQAQKEIKYLHHYACVKVFYFYLTFYATQMNKKSHLPNIIRDMSKNICKQIIEFMLNRSFLYTEKAVEKYTNYILYATKYICVCL